MKLVSSIEIKVSGRIEPEDLDTYLAALAMLGVTYIRVSFDSPESQDVTQLPAILVRAQSLLTPHQGMVSARGLPA